MIGQLKQYDEVNDLGHIVVAGAPADRAYTFRKDDWPARLGMAVGTRVEFDATDDGCAINIRFVGPILREG